MSPTLTYGNAVDLGLGDPVQQRQFTEGEVRAQFTNAAHVLFSKFRERMLGPRQRAIAKCGDASGILRMPSVQFPVTPLQVREVVVLPVEVFMVHFGLRLWRRAVERLTYQTVNELLMCSPITTKANLEVTKREIENDEAGVGTAYPVDSTDSAVGADFIAREPCDRSPLFTREVWGKNPLRVSGTAVALPMFGAKAERSRGGGAVINRAFHRGSVPRFALGCYGQCSRISSRIRSRFAVALRYSLHAGVSVKGLPWLLMASTAVRAASTRLSALSNRSRYGRSQLLDAAGASCESAPTATIAPMMRMAVRRFMGVTLAQRGASAV